MYCFRTSKVVRHRTGSTAIRLVLRRHHISAEPRSPEGPTAGHFPNTGILGSAVSVFAQCANRTGPHICADTLYQWVGIFL